MDNICKFVPSASAHDVIKTIEFVLETERKNIARTSLAFYRIYYVLSGSARITGDSIVQTVKAGDVFFVFPVMRYAIEGNEDFRYMYISFLGLRANELTDKFGITPRNFVFENMDALGPVWELGISQALEVADLSSEAVLLQTFAMIGSRVLEKQEAKEISDSEERFLLVKKYIDENFTDIYFSLDKVSQEFSYNKKYISSTFKKYFKVGIQEYVNTLRINYACTLIEQNYTGIADIAFLCGVKDAMYFSKIFKKRVGLSPREYVQKKGQIRA